MAFYQSLKWQSRYPRGTEKPGQAGWIAQRLLRLRALLNSRITSVRRPNSLIIGSWNIRHFDGGRPRLNESFHYIAEIIDHFDICAIQEVKSLEAMEKLSDLLGPNWDYFINDSSGGGRGNHERMAFIYNRNKVQFRNLIGELVVPKDALPGGEQIGRTPFFAAFQAGWFKFTLCSAHIVFTEQAGRPLREDEIAVIAGILRSRAKEADESHILIGDMNIEKVDDAGMKALTSNGFHVPMFGTTNLTGTSHFDHIAFTGPSKEGRILNHGKIEWKEAVFTDDEAADYMPIAMEQRATTDPIDKWTSKYRGWTSHEMSDHLPIWIELETDYSNEYLLRISELT